MKLTTLVTALLYATISTAHTDFIKDGTRAEIFELMDDEVPNFRISMPAAEFNELKNQIGAGGGGFFKRQWNGNMGGGNMGGGNMGGFNMGGFNMGGNTGGNTNMGGFNMGGNTGGNTNMGGFNMGGNTGGNTNMGGFNMGGNTGGNMGGFNMGGNTGGNMGGFNMGGGNMGGFGGGNGGGFGGGFGGGGFGFGQTENYKVKNATMVVEIKGQKKVFDRVNFGIGGSSSRSYARQAFNLKIKGKENLFGRKQFRIRSDAREATYLRSKLACDIHNRLGIPSISANYMSLYVNDEYWGFYVIMDSPKPSWAELQYGDKDTTHIYKCKNGGNVLSVSSSATSCMNENEEVTDISDWRDVLSRIDSARSARDIEDIFDVDQFLYEMAYEYLSGSWDHFLNSAHNFAMYKMPEQYGGKWTMIEYDFDADFGQDVSAIEFMGSVKDDKDYPSWSFTDWANKQRHIVDILILNDDTRFKKIVWDMIEKVFNPETLFDRIDELKDFIRPYVKKDKTPVNGRKPGMLNTKATNDYTMEQWEANSEFTNLGISASSSGYGLKYWILNRYRKACNLYKFNCDPVYMDLNYYYDVDRSVEGPINTSFSMGFAFGGGGQQQQQSKPKTTQSQPPKPAGYTSTKKTRTTTIKSTVTQSSGNTDCAAKAYGYACCSPNNTSVIYQDEIGDWGVENGDWCGITKAAKPSCWAEKLGFSCCSTCSEVIYVDGDGNWGIENNNWCGLTC